ncbi:hypothetical protein SAMN05660657_04392 [Geodermatophilus amargosae]|uniref:Secreted protein n=1 Tax=Geodermatophilus amargosae TaxID=1296565 RepID=A0A1I7CEA7_9ACTN|nr:hypothetical protein [Geodermatophilus amargosae]SFT97760.1 hypothetical protein SAMN05660657_04392 [Geodermatophilus amargosae]
MIKRSFAVLAAAVALGVLSVGTAQAAPADTAPCKSGGYANYVDPATDLPFANQGQCVSVVNHGGILVPVEEEPSVIATLTNIPADGWMGFTCRVELDVSGPAGTYLVESYRNGHFYRGEDIVVP